MSELILAIVLEASFQNTNTFPSQMGEQAARTTWLHSYGWRWRYRLGMHL